MACSNQNQFTLGNLPIDIIFFPDYDALTCTKFGQITTFQLLAKIMLTQIDLAQIRLDNEGYIVDPSQWTEELAHYFADKEDIALSDDHWLVVRFMRDYYAEREIAPDVRHVIKHLKNTTGAGRNYIFELFPYGYVKQACKIAGMKRPRAWSTG